VILAARRLEKLQAIQQTIEAGHGLASTVALDVLDFESVRPLGVLVKYHEVSIFPSSHG
jgi:NADP-dependent 3-hydroxy acid dehydrogenase YdfG